MPQPVTIWVNAAAATRKRSLLFLLAVAVFAGYLCTVIFDMQVTRHDYYRRKVIDQITTSSAMKARRGVIYDSNMNVLATTQTVWRVFLSPVDIAEATSDTGTDYPALIADGLSRILSMSRETVLSKAKQSGTIDVTLKKAVDEATYRAVETFISQNHLENMVHTEANLTRYYPLSAFACHVVGFTGADNQGLFGLESKYDEVLRGTDGYYIYAKDAKGNEMPDGYIGYIEPQDGCSLVTTIDAFMQKQLEYKIKEIEETFCVQNRVTGIVMNVNTGAILAMATTSAFDLNDPYSLDSLFQAKLDASGYAAGSDEYKKYKTELLYTMWQNKAVSEPYEPGSTFKIVTVSTGLETGAVSTSNHYVCTGSYRIGGYNISCHKRKGHGDLTLGQALQQSCNPAMIQISAATGAQKFYEYVTAFGYLEKTGIDLPSEGTSIFHKPDALGITELATASFGQRFKITPLQQIRAIAAVANGGFLVTPYIVQNIIDPNGEIIYTHQTQVERQVISVSTSKTVSEILEQGVSGDGGAKNAAVPGYKIAAKTGTSEKFDILDENGNSYLRIGSCIGYAPSDKAEIAILIIVDEPTTAKYGSMVAAPSISDLMEVYLPYLGYESAKQAESTTVTVAAYEGMSVAEAKKCIKDLKLKVRIIGEGDRVVSQMPTCGSEIDCEQGTVLLYTEHGEKDEVTVPSFLNMKATDANRAILEAGLNLKIGGVANRDIGAGAVVAMQSIPPGTRVARGTVVELTFLYTDDTD